MQYYAGIFGYVGSRRVVVFNVPTEDTIEQIVRSVISIHGSLIAAKLLPEEELGTSANVGEVCKSYLDGILNDFPTLSPTIISIRSSSEELTVGYVDIKYGSRAAHLLDPESLVATIIEQRKFVPYTSRGLKAFLPKLA